MRKLQWAVGAFTMVLLLASVLMARQGMVVTQDGDRYSGDITDMGKTVDIVRFDAQGKQQKITLNKGNIKDIIFADQVAEQVRQERAKLDKRDVKGRLQLAQFAAQNGAYDAARDVLEEAQALEPANQEVKAQLQSVNAQLRMARGEKAATQTPPTQPTTAAPATQASAVASGGSSAPPSRMVTPEEINRIRQLEWDKREPMRMTIDRDARTRFLAGSDVTVAQFQQLNVNEQAIQILTKGKPELADGVHILSDPLSVAAFKAKVQKIVLSGCAANGCHGGPAAKGGSFYLFTTGDPTKMAYTNFLTLQTFHQNVDKIQQPLVNREFPEKSLLLQYMLPRNVAETPHPDVPNFKPVVRAKNDVRFQTTLEWIRLLSSVVPDYGIDLTKEPEKKPPAGRKTR